MMGSLRTKEPATARETGESTLVRMFAAMRQLELAVLKFERNSEISVCLSNDPSQTLAIVLLLLDKALNPGLSILFLDETQAVIWVLADGGRKRHNLFSLSLYMAGQVRRLASVKMA